MTVPPHKAVMSTLPLLFGFSSTPREEQQRFAQSHPDLYSASADGQARLRISRGELHIDSLVATGFGHRADPAFDTMLPLQAAAGLLGDEFRAQVARSPRSEPLNP